jgi:hypothetical protein
VWESDNILPCPLSSSSPSVTIVWLKEEEGGGGALFANRRREEEELYLRLETHDRVQTNEAKSKRRRASPTYTKSRRDNTPASRCLPSRRALLASQGYRRPITPQGLGVKGASQKGGLARATNPNNQLLASEGNRRGGFCKCKHPEPSSMCPNVSIQCSGYIQFTRVHTHARTRASTNTDTHMS